MNPIILDDDTKIGAYEIKPTPNPDNESVKDELKPGFFQTLSADIGANNDTLNFTLNAFSNLYTFSELLQPDNTDFNPLDEQYLEMVSPEHWGNLGTSKTKGELFRKVARINQEEYDKKIAAEGSGWANLTAGVVNAVTSPLTLIPITRAAKFAKFLPGYTSWFKNVMPSIIGGAAVSEANLYFTQESRTVKEAALNVATVSIMGSILGGIGTAYRAVKFNTYKDIIQSTVEGALVKFNLEPDGSLKGFSVIDDSAGAQVTRDIDLAGESLYGMGESGEIKVAKPFFWLAANLFQNPVVKATFSKSGMVRKFTNDALEHNYEIAKTVTKGEFPQEALQTAIWTRQAKAVENDFKLANAYYEYLGVDPNQNMAARKVKGLLKDKKDLLPYDKFLEDIHLATTKGGVSDNPLVQREAKRIIDDILMPTYHELVDFNILPPNLTPFGAVQHVMRSYDKERIIATRPQKREFLINKFSETNDKIQEVVKPVETMKARVAALKEDLLSVTNLSQMDTLKADLNRAQKQLKVMERQLQDGILDGKYSPDMLTGNRGMDLKQIKQLRTLRKPIRESQKKIKQLERELQVYTNKRNPNRLPGQKNVPIDKKQKALQKTILEEKNKLKAYREDIGQKLDKGEISQNLAFRNQQGNWRLKKANPGTLKFRSLLDPSGLIEAADSALDNILGLSEEQLFGELLGTFKAGSGTNPLMPRTLLINDEDLIKEGFLITDMRSNVSRYNLKMARLIEMEKYARAQGYDGEGNKLEFLTNRIKSDYSRLEMSLEKNVLEKSQKLSGKALEKFQKTAKKERLDLEKDLKSDVDLVTNIYKRIMGVSDIKTGNFVRTVRAMKSWAYSTQLGAAGLVCLSDAMAPIYRQGFLPYMSGIKSFIVNAAKLSKNNERFRQSARDMALGIETLQAFNAQKFDLGQEIFMPMNFVERGLDVASRAMSVLNVSSPMSDQFQFIASTASQSRLVRDLKAFKEGTLSKTYFKQLQNLRLDPKVWGDRILSQVKEHGEDLSGSLLPNWHLWTDKDAKRVFQGAVRKEVLSTNFSGSNIASYPIGIEPGGLGSSLLTYMGWIFNATANFTLPALQRMDLNKATGIISMIAVSALVEPLRDIADGKDPDLEPEQLFKSALLNSGMLGLYGDVFNRLNAMGNIAPSLQLDRFKHTRGMINFAPEGLIEDVAKVLGATANGEMNRKDAQRALRVVPLSRLIYLRNIGNELIDSLDLPKDRKQAEKMSDWR